MSIRYLIDKISADERLKISQDLYFEKPEKFNSEPIYGYDINDNKVYVPFNYALQFGWAKRPKNLPKANMKFEGKLRPLQVKVSEEMKVLLNKQSSCILSLYTGGGKTFTSIYIACKLKLKTLIIVNRVILIKQWKETIVKASPLSKIQIIYTKTKMDLDADFYIINAINVYKKGREFFKDIGCIIADEIHLLATNVLSKCFFYIYPRYLIGLSATPKRPDGMDKMLYAFFGKDIIHYKLYRKHQIYKITTGLKPEFTIARNGKIDWNSLLNWQAQCEERNNKIVQIVIDNPDRIFLILCKRIIQVELLVELLKNKNETVSSLTGSKKTFDTTARILIGTVQKCGVGFDHPRLNSLIIAADLLEYFIQYLGRVFRTEKVEPIIFDLVDDHAILYKHYLTRRRVYIDHGGSIKRGKISSTLRLLK